MNVKCSKVVQVISYMNSAFFTVIPCILMLSKSFIYQLMHNRLALQEY